jgi:hypothetical protein
MVAGETSAIYWVVCCWMESFAALAPADGQRGGTVEHRCKTGLWAVVLRDIGRSGHVEVLRNYREIGIRKQMASRLLAQDKTERVDVFIGGCPRLNLDLEAQLKTKDATFTYLSIGVGAGRIEKIKHTWTMLCIFSLEVARASCDHLCRSPLTI